MTSISWAVRQYFVNLPSHGCNSQTRARVQVKHRIQQGITDTKALFNVSKKPFFGFHAIFVTSISSAVTQYLVNLPSHGFN